MHESAWIWLPLKLGHGIQQTIYPVMIIEACNNNSTNVLDAMVSPNNH